jgi:hypothetical protein
MSAETVVDVGKVLAGLKDFQQDTVNYVFERLYDSAKPSLRFLVADEVGLGKTLVARGLIARTIQHLKATSDARIDIVYVCSNADIARQNINRLNVTGSGGFNPVTRLTLLPTYLHGLKQNDVNFVSFTPSTSFDLKSRGGLATERALLYWLLHHVWGWEPSRDEGVLRLLQSTSRSLDRFRDLVHWTARVGTGPSDIDPDLADAFGRELEIESATSRLRDQFEDLAARLADPAHHDWESSQRFVGAVRQTLARSCVHALEPDLIILDEFQRFRDLLDGESDAAELAQSLFNYPAARMLLLSATPYKMHTLPEEVEAGDEHYADFQRTTRFLMMGHDSEAAADLAADLRSLRDGLLSLTGDHPDLAPVRASRRRVERRLRAVMSRTERLAIESEGNGMVVDSPTGELQLSPGDLRAYVAAERLRQILEAPDMLEYWKSAPYLLNFMESYKVKQKLHAALEVPERRAQLAAALPGGEGLLSVEELERKYGQVDSGNARMRWLMESMAANKSWRLLWLPPALPYYELAPPFEDAIRLGFTKRLVFSAWWVVPQAISTLLSYEAERRMMTEAELRSPEERRRIGTLLRFQRRGEGDRHPGGMSLLALMYPSTMLAELGDPLRVARGFRARSDGRLPSAEQLHERVRRGIAQKLRPLVKGHMRGPVDEAWYWAAPLLLDGSAASEWLNSPVGAHTHGERSTPLEKLWQTESDDPGDPTGVVPDDTAESGALADAIDAARKLVAAATSLGRPPGDLYDVLARLALAGPAVCALRALARVADGLDPYSDLALRDGAAQAAWGFRSLFNVPEVVAMVRYNTQRDYWLSVLEYCLGGGLQAVLDEYAHVLKESLGILDQDRPKIGIELGRAMHDAVAVRATTYVVEDIRVGGRDQVTISRKRLRARYALRFGDQTSDDGRDVQRANRVRNAFNSPFWPFVLATTSIGQEGLDFHQYCHAVVHWNLPANPVDLEQREGRVHRYKGHAIRKNVAARHRRAAFASAVTDPWEAMFRAAVDARPKGQRSDLVPYWVYTDGPARIERFVPSLPLSREVEKLRELRRSLAVYRLAFGQPRQDDLTAYLAGLPPAVQEKVRRECLIDLTPKPSAIVKRDNSGLGGRRR